MRRNDSRGSRRTGKCRTFRRCERGGATVEILLWLPFLVEIMLVTVDVSQLYWRHGEMWTVARDAARQTVIGTLPADDAAVTDYVQARLTAGHAVDFIDNGDSYTVVVGGNEEVMSLFGTMTGVFGDLSAAVTLAVEDY